jgi:DNA (cytosine-5)-methyltransferase 1
LGGGVSDGLAKRLEFSWPDEPEGIPRVAKGIPDRVSRLKAIGNGQVPRCAALAWMTLIEGWLEINDETKKEG